MAKPALPRKERMPVSSAPVFKILGREDRFDPRSLAEVVKTL
jgi:hypothetical protein